MVPRNGSTDGGNADRFCLIHSSQAWAILHRHAKEDIASLRLAELCEENDRVSSLVAVYNTSFQASSTTTEQPNTNQTRMLIADLSRQRMTLETLNYLLKLAHSCQLKKFIAQLAWGQNDPAQPVVPKRVRGRVPSDIERKRVTLECIDDQTSVFPSMHMSLRAPRGSEMLTLEGENACAGNHVEWDRIRRLSESIRRGQLRGVTGSMLRDVVVIGQGVPVAALNFVYNALLYDERAMFASRAGLVEAASARLRRNLAGGISGTSSRRLHFISNMDPVSAAVIVKELDPGCTLVISIALAGNEDTGLATRSLKSWLLHELGNNRKSDHILGKHMMLVTGNDRIASVINKPESVHLIPGHSRCEAFTTFTAASLLPLSIVFGWPIVEEFIAGAHDMDVHFVETNPRHNIPVLLALTDVWNSIQLETPARCVTPFTEAFVKYPAFVAALEAQVCGKQKPSAAKPAQVATGSIIVDGGLSCSLDRMSYESPIELNSELVITLDSQINFNTSRATGSGGMDEIYSVQDALMCSFFAHADELAFGPGYVEAKPISPVNLMRSGESAREPEGNHSSVLMICDRLDVFTCGQLIALAEHRAICKAHIWGLDPFTKEVGSSLRAKRVDTLKGELQKLLFEGDAKVLDENEVDGMILSTKTILGHYATLMKDKRASLR